MMVVFLLLAMFPPVSRPYALGAVTPPAPAAVRPSPRRTSVRSRSRQPGSARVRLPVRVMGMVEMGVRDVRNRGGRRAGPRAGSRRSSGGSEGSHCRRRSSRKRRSDVASRRSPPRSRSRYDRPIRSVTRHRPRHGTSVSPSVARNQTARRARRTERVIRKRSAVRSRRPRRRQRPAW